MLVLAISLFITLIKRIEKTISKEFKYYFDSLRFTTNNFNETSFIGVENVSINEVENEYGSLNENFAINVNEIIEIGLSSMVENVII